VTMAWPVDEAKLSRVREAMAERDLDALVCRAPDNLLYLTSYWCMKGYDAVVFPREGEPTLVVIEPQLADAQRSAWTSDIRLFAGYDERDPRPPHLRAADVVADVLRERDLGGRVGVELTQASQGSDRMVGEPTLLTADVVATIQGASRELVDATGLLAGVRARKTEQEIERMRLANELAELGLEHVREHIRPGMRESEVGALFEGRVHAEGVGYQGRVEMARAFTLVWSGPGISTFTATGDRPVQVNEPTLMEIWVCADGYWTDLTKNFCPGPLSADYERLLTLLLGVFAEAVDHARPGASLAELDRLIRARLSAGGYPGQPSHPVAHGVGARAHEPPYAHQAGGGELHEGMVLAIEPAAYWPGGGGLRLEDDFLIGADGAEKLCSWPDDFRLDAARPSAEGASR
jgi:Xaa-Pro aminopeptidase